MNILLIDNDSNIRNTTTKLLSSTKSNIIAISSRNEITKYLNFDIFIINDQQLPCDINLKPELPLQDTINIIKQTKNTPIKKLPIIILSNNSIPYDLPIIKKPFNFLTLIHAIIEKKIDYLNYSILQFDIFPTKWNKYTN